MTVTYTGEVATSTGLGCFIKLLIRWRGSIYKLVYADLLLFLAIYYILNISYLYVMDNGSRTYFEKIVKYCAKHGSLIPLSFVLGFYVNIVFTRWWSQYTSIPFPDNLAILVGASIKGQDEKSRMVRRTIVRYVCLSFTITLSLMSPKVKKRFPSLNHYVDAGLLTMEEKKLVEDLDNEYPSYSKYWLPIAWAASITTRCRHEGMVTDDLSMKGILEELNAFRSKCGSMLDYDWISIPLVYTQVVTLATYSFFLVTVIGNQFIERTDESDADLLIFSFPFMPIVEFFFYMGWLKVAETLINPFGDDDDDFEVVWMVDRHIQVCFLLVDKIHQEHPKLVKDFYWEQRVPDSLPFTIASQSYMKEYPESSTDNIKVKSMDQDIVVPEFRSQADSTDDRSGSALWNAVNGIFVRRRKGIRGVPLKRVTSHLDDLNTAGMLPGDNIDSIVNITTVLKTPPQADVKDFDELRKDRLSLHRERVLKYVELLKPENKDKEKLIEDLIK